MIIKIWKNEEIIQFSTNYIFFYVSKYHAWTIFIELVILFVCIEDWTWNNNSSFGITQRTNKTIKSPFWFFYKFDLFPIFSNFTDFGVQTLNINMCDSGADIFNLDVLGGIDHHHHHESVGRPRNGLQLPRAQLGLVVELANGCPAKQT